MPWDKATAKSKIQKFFIKHKVSAKKAAASASDGKVYELFCLVQTLKWLKSQYKVTIRFMGSTVDFKASPGNIDRSKSYFEIIGNGNTLELHTDIEVQSLGSRLSRRVFDNSGYHEIDLVLVTPDVQDGQKPCHDQLFLGVECKTHANFSKEIVRQVLGVRRELSLLQNDNCLLDQAFGVGSPRLMMASPASLYWLAFTDPKGLKYAHSPLVFEIEFMNWRP